MVLASVGLNACAGFNKKSPPPPTPMEEDSLKPAPAPSADGLEKIDKSNIPDEPKKTGFFGTLAKAVQGDSGLPNVGPCPSVKVLYDASRFVEISGDLKFDNVGFTGEIQNVTSACRYVGTDPITLGLSIDMALGKGPKAKGDKKAVNYWIAVTRKDIAPINKQSFSGEVVFPAGADRVRMQTPEVTIEIPRADKEISGVNFEILVGFDLTEEQLKFNRDGIRFKIDAGAKN